MKTLRFVSLAILLLLGPLFSFSQMKAFLNGKELATGSTIQLEEIQKLTFKFSNAKKVEGSLDGYASVFVREKGDPGQYCVSVTGSAACGDLISNASNREFVLMNEAGKGDMKMADYYLMEVLKNTYVNKAGFEKMTFEAGVNFASKTGYNKYGTLVDLLEPFVFTIEVWSGVVQVKDMNMHFAAADLPEFQKMRTPETVQMKKRSLVIWKFDEADATAAAAKITALKASLENYLGYYANVCSGSKYAKLFTAPDAFWKEKTFFDEKDILAKMNKKANPEGTFQVWRPFTAGSISGFKFSSEASELDCEEGKILLGTSGYDVTCIFIHPTIPNRIIIMTDRDAEDLWGYKIETDLVYSNAQMDAFLKAVKFD